jgi:hypothetical protein
LLGPLSDTNAPDLRALSDYRLFKSVVDDGIPPQSEVTGLATRYSSAGIVDALLLGMEPRMRCRSAAVMLLRLLTVDPMRRPDFFSVVKSDFLLSHFV